MKMHELVQVMKTLKNLLDCLLPDHTPIPPCHPAFLTLSFTRLPTPSVFMPMKSVEESFLPKEVLLIKRQFVVIFSTGFLTRQTLQHIPESTFGFCGSFVWVAYEILPVVYILHQGPSWSRDSSVKLLTQLALKLFQLWQINNSMVITLGNPTQMALENTKETAMGGGIRDHRAVVGAVEEIACYGLQRTVRGIDMSRTLHTSAV